MTAVSEESCLFSTSCHLLVALLSTKEMQYSTFMSGHLDMSTSCPISNIKIRIMVIAFLHCKYVFSATWYSHLDTLELPISNLVVCKTKRKHLFSIKSERRRIFLPEVGPQTLAAGACYLSCRSKKIIQWIKNLLPSVWMQISCCS